MKTPQILDLYSDDYLSSFVSVTSFGLSNLLSQGYSHDQMSRFLSQQNMFTKQHKMKYKYLLWDACFSSK